MKLVDELNLNLKSKGWLNKVDKETFEVRKSAIIDKLRAASDLGCFEIQWAASDLDVDLFVWLAREGLQVRYHKDDVCTVWYEEHPRIDIDINELVEIISKMPRKVENTQQQVPMTARFLAQFEDWQMRIKIIQLISANPCSKEQGDKNLALAQIYLDSLKECHFYKIHPERKNT